MEVVEKKRLLTCLLLAALLSSFLGIAPAVAEASAASSSVATPKLHAMSKAQTPTSVSLSPTKATIQKGAKITFIASVLPDGADNKAVNYKSSNKKIATVSKSGVVTGKSIGTVTITVTTKSGKRKASAKVTVVAAVKPTSVSLSKKTATLYVGDKLSPTITVYPKNATNKTVTWKSSDKKIATVSSSGQVVAKKAGKAKIVVTTKVNKKTATLTLTIKKKILPTRVTLTPAAGQVKVGDKLSLKATVSPSNTTDKSVTYASNNIGVATVSSSGVVKGIKAGTAKITVKTKANGKSKSVKVTVVDSSDDAVVDNNESVRRAFLIGQEKYSSPLYLSGPRRDANSVKNALLLGGFKSATTYFDLAGKGITKVLSNMSSMGIKSTDVTVFYYSGHGAESKIAENRGALVGVDGDMVTVDSVRQLLDKVPGTIIVIMDSCLSGQFIVTKSSGENVEIASDPAAYNQSIIDAFATPVVKGIADSSPEASRYKILTSTSALGDSYLLSSGVSLFTKHLSRGCGYDPFNGKCDLLADANKNKNITLHEAYKYIIAGVKKENLSYYGSDQEQVAQIWPTGDNFILINR